VKIEVEIKPDWDLDWQKVADAIVDGVLDVYPDAMLRIQMQ